MQVVYLLQCYDDDGGCCSRHRGTLGVFTSVEAAKTAAKHFDEDLVWNPYNNASSHKDDEYTAYGILPAVLQDEEDAHDQVRAWRIKDIEYYEHRNSLHSYAYHLVRTVEKEDFRSLGGRVIRTTDHPRRGRGRVRISG